MGGIECVYLVLEFVGIGKVVSVLVDVFVCSMDVGEFVIESVVVF